MKVFSFLWVILVSGLQAGGLIFPTPLQEVHADPEAQHVVAEFPFKNETTKPIKITKLDAGCSCLAVAVGDGGAEIPAGGSGVIKATFDIGKFDGTVDKAIGVWVDGGTGDVPSQELTMRVVIPVVISLEPKTVKWKSHSDLTPQKIHVRINSQQPIKITSVTTDSLAFSHSLTSIKEGSEYEITITPLTTERLSIGLFRIATDSSAARYQVMQVFAVVSAPGKP